MKLVNNNDQQVFVAGFRRYELLSVPGNSSITLSNILDLTSEAIYFYESYPMNGSNLEVEIETTDKITTLTEAELSIYGVESTSSEVVLNEIPKEVKVEVKEETNISVEFDSTPDAPVITLEEHTQLQDKEVIETTSEVTPEPIEAPEYLKSEEGKKRSRR